MLSVAGDRLCPVLILFSELVCQSPDLPVLESYLSVIGDKQDTVIRYGFFTIGCPNAQVVGLKADVGTARPGMVVWCTAIDIPHPNFANVVAVIVPGTAAGVYGWLTCQRNAPNCYHG